MREIKFRARDENNTKWIYFNLFDLADFTYIKERCIVDEKTICEYTGIKDKNEKEIYEADIVRDTDGKLGEIKFDGGMFKIYWNSGEINQIQAMGKFIEIIGDKYETSNPK